MGRIGSDILVMCHFSKNFPRRWSVRVRNPPLGSDRDWSRGVSANFRQVFGNDKHPRVAQF